MLFFNPRYPGIQSTDKMEKAGIIIFNFYFYQMESNEDGTILGEDIEALHDMRVASRRMRVALNIFRDYYTRKKIKKVAKKLRKIGDNLGYVRDLDVIIGKVEEYRAETDGENGVGLSYIHDYLIAKRVKTRDHLIRYLTGTQYNTEKHVIRSFIDSPKLTDSLEKQEYSVGEETMGIIDYQNMKINNLDAEMLTPTIEHLHKLRIAFKRLRYSIEIFYNSIGDEVAQSIELLKGIQNYLGDINDKSILLDEIKGLLTNWRRTQFKEESLFDEIDQFTIKIEDERESLISNFTDNWQQYCEFPFNL